MTTSPGQWSFTRWRTLGQLEALEVHNPRFSATLFLQGAHLAHYAPAGAPNWLWLSPEARFEPGRAIRGGIPVCWPWFGDPGRNPPEVRKRVSTTTAHGFARTALWQLESVEESAHQVVITLSLDCKDDFRELWDGQARARISFRFSAIDCQVALATTNTGNDPLAYTQALHTYLPTADISRTRISGLEGATYLDTLNDWRPRVQEGPVEFPGETDRIYESGAPLTIATPAGAMLLTASGSDSTVVWNPGPDKARRLSDFPDAAWKEMLCVETANAGNDYQVLNAGQSRTLGFTLRRG